MANFHFSYVYGNLHSDENTLAMTMQKTIFVEANITNVSVMYQPHRPYDFRGDDFGTVQELLPKYLQRPTFTFSPVISLWKL